jgi:mono/diheme cytochrome c family protein
MKHNITVIFILFAFVSLLSACYYDNIEDLHPAPIIIPGVNDSLSGAGCDTNKAITYTADIKAIFQANCAGCHTGTGSSSGIDLLSYNGAKNIANKLVGSVTWDGTTSNMPKNSPKINDCSIAKIKKWVNTGTAE